jgi:cell division septation protein DedD
VPQDFAKLKRDTSSRKAGVEKAQARRNTGNNQPRGNGFRPYLAGVLTGVFLSFLVYLGTLPNPADPALDTGSSPPAAEIPKPRFDFYTLLPKQTLDEEKKPDAVEPAADVSKPPAASSAPEPFLLQAGAFRQRDDAERRRAELVLLGLTPKLEEISNANGRWFRVYVGPFDSHESMNKARGLMANQNIDTVLLKRGGA